MAITRKDTIIQAQDLMITNKSGQTAVKREGTTVEKLAVATYDVSSGDSGSAEAHGLGVYIPAKAVITRAIVDVVSTFTDGDTDAATIALSVQSANDLVSAIAISDTSNVWDAGVRGSKIGFPNFGADSAHDSAVEVAALFAGSMLKTTAVREITATVGTAAVTAGKMNVYVWYVISD
jgi:hypothetical protein